MPSGEKNPAGKCSQLESRCCDFPDQKVFELPMIWKCKGMENLLKNLTRLLQVVQSGLHLQDCLCLKAVGESFVGEDTHWLQQLIIVTFCVLSYATGSEF
jgi:hypothetical protein